MDYIKELTQKLTAITNTLKEEVMNFRTNRPTTKLVENIQVDYMGTMMPIKSVATMTIELPRDIIISPWDRGVLGQVEKAIQDAKMGLSASVQGVSVRVKLPDLTEETRDELIKVVKRTGEEAKIKIRMTRDEFNKKLKELKDEDAKFRGKDDVQKQVDIANKTVDGAIEAKIKEIQE